MHRISPEVKPPNNQMSGTTRTFSRDESAETSLALRWGGITLAATGLLAWFLTGVGLLVIGPMIPAAGALGAGLIVFTLVMWAQNKQGGA